MEGDEIRAFKRAEEQHGVISRSQLLESLTLFQLERRVRLGRVEKLFPCVYRVVGSPAAPRQLVQGVALWLRRGYTFSHRTAAALHQLRGFELAPVEVTSSRSVRGRPGVITHWVQALHHRDVTTRESFRVTTVSRTLVDLCSVLEPPELRAAVDEALGRRQTTLDQLEGVLERTGSVRGVNHLRKLLLTYRGGDGPTESELERKVLTFLEGYRFPTPRLQRPIQVGRRRARLDLFFETQGVVIEADGYATHSDVVSFERDRQRRNSLSTRGYVVLQWTWRALEDRPEELAEELQGLLHARGGQDALPRCSL